MKGIPFADVLAGGTKFEWVCLDCPRLYVLELYAVRHAITHLHAVRPRQEIAGWDREAPHPFVACVSGQDRPRRVVCCLCSLSRPAHAAWGPEYA